MFARKKDLVDDVTEPKSYKNVFSTSIMSNLDTNERNKKKNP